jgi:hypothetical protein
VAAIDDVDRFARAFPAKGVLDLASTADADQLDEPIALGATVVCGDHLARKRAVEVVASLVLAELPHGDEGRTGCILERCFDLVHSLREEPDEQMLPLDAPGRGSLEANDHVARSPKFISVAATEEHKRPELDPIRLSHHVRDRR